MLYAGLGFAKAGTRQSYSTFFDGGELVDEPRVNAGRPGQVGDRHPGPDRLVRQGQPAVVRLRAAGQQARGVAGRTALSNKNYDQTIEQANIALMNEPASTEAVQLKTDAAEGQLHLRNYQSAMAAAKDALQKDDFDTAIAQADVALSRLQYAFAVSRQPMAPMPLIREVVS